MRLLIRYLDGSFDAAILMATIGCRLRVAAPGNEDIVEFKWADGQWLAENGQAVDIEFDAAPDEFYRWAEAGMARRELSHATAHGLSTARQPYAPSIAPVN